MLLRIICSVSKGLEAITPFVATQYAGIGALVDHKHARQNLFRRILGTRNFSGQTRRVAASAPLSRSDLNFASGTTMWIGHGVARSYELDDPEERLKRLSKGFRQNYARELRRLLSKRKHSATSSSDCGFRTHQF